MKKWFGFSLGALLGISHIGMIGMISQGTKIPKVNLPIGEYTAYTVKAGPDGYFINYRAHDPKVMTKVQEVNRPAGFLGLGRKNAVIEEQYMAEGALHTFQFMIKMVSNLQHIKLHVLKHKVVENLLEG